MVDLVSQIVLRLRPHGKNARGFAGVFLLCLWLTGCASLVPQSAVLRDSWPEGLPERAAIPDAPFFPQREYECGPAALATALAHFKVPVTADDLTPMVYIPARRGSVQTEMLAAPRRFGMVAYQLAPKYEDMLREIAAGNPVVVLQRLGLGPLGTWHYATAVEYDHKQGGITLRSGETRDYWMPIPLFETTWKKSDYWAMIAVPPDRIPATADPVRYLQSIVALERAGQPKAAAVAYNAFLKRWPDDVTASIGLANAHYTLGELPKAEPVLKAALEQHPDSVVVMNNLAQTLSDQGRGAEALKVIDRAAASPGAYANAIAQTRAHILEKLEKSGESVRQ